MKNSLTRGISGVVFVVLMILGLTVNKFLFAALFLFIMCTMLSEFYHITMGDRYKVSRGLAIGAGAILFLLLFLVSAYGIPGRYVAVALIPVLVVMTNSLYAKDKSSFDLFSHIYTGLLYIAVPLSLSNLIAFDHGVFSGRLLLCFFIIIWSSDVGAYCAGLTLGKRFPKKLFEEISPKKTWAGFWGGMVSAIIASVILGYTGMFKFPLVHCAILAVVMHVSGVYGDLFESQWKRCHDIKDSGSVIPGHGGMMDRFDSTLFAFPAGVIYLLVLYLI
ncbi:MAG: phosphatidate cytidylyltransferase [Bacteroidales bacterium]|nr:phosphatidate cytidylyltransferase [Bacteroidales bacterium]MDT3356864.1 phosphatidate cytidylyltransferase [Bacteroidota bacterium]